MDDEKIAAELVEVMVGLYDVQQNSLRNYFGLSVEDKAAYIRDEYKSYTEQVEKALFQKAAQVSEPYTERVVSFAIRLRDDFAVEVKGRAESPGQRLKITREGLGLGLKELAKLSGYSVGNINNYENGHRDLTVKAANHIGEVMGGISAIYFLDY